MASATAPPVACTPSSVQLPRWVTHRTKDGALDRIAAAGWPEPNEIDRAPAPVTSSWSEHVCAATWFC